LWTVPALDLQTVSKAGLRRREDTFILQYAAKQNRVLLTHDVNTLPGFAYERVERRLPMPGVIVVPADLGIGVAIEELHLLLECGAPVDFENQVIHVPL